MLIVIDCRRTSPASQWGSTLRRILGLRFRDFHTPVPGYRARLEKTMDRFFTRIAVGEVVKRVIVSCACAIRDLTNGKR